MKTRIASATASPLRTRGSPTRRCSSTLRPRWARVDVGSAATGNTRTPSAHWITSGHPPAREEPRPPSQRSSRQDPPRIATPSPDPTSWAAMPPPPLPQQRTCAPGDIHPQPPRSLPPSRVQRPSHGETPVRESCSGVTSNDIERFIRHIKSALEQHCSKNFADIGKKLDQHFAGLRAEVDPIKQGLEQVQICQCQSSVYPAAVESPDPEPDSVARSTSRPIVASPVGKAEDDDKDLAMSDGTPSWAFAASDQVATVTTPSRTRTHLKKQEDPKLVTKPHPSKYYLRKRKARQRKN